jgi:3-hydroxymyristoyl/3-hydroxydecanoyl-(acyl carrier protein) dehydratase
MDEHFRAYSFVDRITSIEDGIRIRGTYAIPHELEMFPLPLLAESVGQLAAWAAMSAVNFERRPVAGIAGGIDLLARAKPGQTLELQAELESVDQEAVAYGGSALVNGIPVIRLEHCVGPMLPMEEFEDPQIARGRFALLCGDGAEPGTFHGLPAISATRMSGEKGKWLRATFDVPVAAPFFADHFPRRPVFPGTLLMQVNLELVAALGNEIPPPANGTEWIVRKVSDVKLRSFIAPGEALEIEVKLVELLENSASMSVKIQKGNKTIGDARVLLLPKDRP